MESPESRGETTLAAESGESRLAAGLEARARPTHEGPEYWMEIILIAAVSGIEAAASWMSVPIRTEGRVVDV